MKTLFWIFFLPFAVAVTVFAVNNRDHVSIDLDPLPYPPLSIPLYLAVLIPALAGFIIGICLDWIKQGKWRRMARELRKKTSRLEMEAATLHEAVDSQSRRTAAGHDESAEVTLPERAD